MAQGLRSNFENFFFFFGGGGHISDSIFRWVGGGGAQLTFILTLCTLKNNWGGGTLVTLYLGGGGAQVTFILTLCTLKNNWGGGHVLPQPPCSAVPLVPGVRMLKLRIDRIIRALPRPLWVGKT